VIRSMTGFGEASAQSEGVHYFLEVRSLNSKYFKAVIRLPEDLQGLEAELEALLRRTLVRGAVTLVGKTTDTSADAAQDVNHRALTRYVEQLRHAPAVADGTVPIDLGALLTLPGVLQPPANEEETLDRARKVFMDLLERACAQLMEMRRREGTATYEALEEQRIRIAEGLERIASRAPMVVEEYHQRLRTRVESMLQEAGATVEPSDLIREVAVYAERSDIAEETTRLSGHIKQFHSLISSKKERTVGRTLDFLAQEMLREANTIASKSNDAEISREIVEIKGSIDRIKEQVQNVE